MASLPEELRASAARFTTVSTPSLTPLPAFTAFTLTRRGGS